MTTPGRKEFGMLFQILEVPASIPIGFFRLKLGEKVIPKERLCFSAAGLALAGILVDNLSSSLLILSYIDGLSFYCTAAALLFAMLIQYGRVLGKTDVANTQDPFNRGQSTMEIFSFAKWNGSDFNEDNYTFRWTEPMLLVVGSVFAAWNGMWLFTITLIFTAFSLHYIEQRIYERSLSRSIQTGPTPEQRLRQLHELLSRQLINEAEFEAKKRSILQDI